MRVRACTLAVIASKAQPPVLSKQTSDSEEQSKETSLPSVLTLRKEINKGECIAPPPHRSSPSPHTPPLFSQVRVLGTNRRVQLK